MKLKVLHYPNPLLKQKSVSIDSITDEITTLAANLIETMKEEKGIGIAAPQVGILKRLIIVTVMGEPTAMINPTIVSASGLQKNPEGCLSFPGIREQVERPLHTIVSYTNLQGQFTTVELKGLDVRCVLHEIDHLDGKLFIEKMSVVRRAKINKSLRKLTD